MPVTLHYMFKLAWVQKMLCSKEDATMAAGHFALTALRPADMVVHSHLAKPTPEDCVLSMLLC